MMKSAYRSLWKEVAIEPLVWFRIIFGLLMLFSTLRFWYNGWIEDLYIQPKFFFTYYGFDWIHPLSGNGMYWVFGAMTIASVGIILGALYRLSSFTFFLLFTYVELIDKSNYLNHYYFISLMAAILFVLPAHRYFSLDVRWNLAKRKTTIPAWTLLLIKFQLGCVYFFAGIAKLNSMWLFEAQPLTNWLKHHTDFPLIGGLFKYNATAFVFSWAGCIFDLTVAFLLGIRKTRWVAYSAVVFFHLLTGWLFPIGIFPWAMIALTTIFFAPEFHQKIIAKWASVKDVTFPKATPILRKKVVTTLLLTYVGIQLLIPFRYLYYPGELFWTEQGFRFSWRVMLIEKVGTTTFFIEPESGIGRKVVEPAEYLTDQQLKQMSTQPDMILQFAHYLRDTYQDSTFYEGDQIIHMGTPKVYVDAQVALFNDGSRPLINPKVDLAAQPYNLNTKKWILPYE